MLDGLAELTQLRSNIDAGQLPIVQTGHRVVGTDICHFSTPCSMPDDPAQPSGRLIFTGSRAIFAGGARALTIPWHMVAEVVQQERDVALVRHDRETFYRFRCNNYSDALCGGLLARTLSAQDAEPPVLSRVTICLCLHPLPSVSSVRSSRQESSVC